MAGSMCDIATTTPVISRAERNWRARGETVSILIRSRLLRTNSGTLSEHDPRAILSDTLRKVLSGRRVTAGVFMTYLRAAVFEEEVLSLLSDEMVSAEPKLGCFSSRSYCGQY